MEDSVVRLHMPIMIAAMVLLATAAIAQTQAQSQPAPKSATSSKIEDISKWTQQQWDAAKEKWSKETAKWSACQKQADDQKLSGRKSWQFLYDCMMKSG
jgi:basic membrane lipoprotein Med (substrate-binding protein (PBP1-ABC) superfamily)